MRREPGPKWGMSWLLLLGLATLPAAPLAAQSAGETVFQSVCVACHSVGTDRLVGPGLAGVLDRRETDWLLEKITGPDRLIAAGDTISTRLAAEHGMAMPNMGVTEDQAEAVLAYLFAAAPAGVAAAATPAATAPPSEADIALGRALFVGSTRLEGRGPSCMSCHAFSAADIPWGGSLAVDLTGSLERLGAPGVQAILSSPPFPAMRGAYEGKPLTDPEVAALAALLGTTGADQATLAAPSRDGLRLFGTGLLGTGLLLGLSSLIWRGRRTGPVYREMFERQIRSR